MCTDEEEYREFFDLPLSIYLRHPLCLSVAHKIHGKSMATGWTRKPRHLSDRNNDLNNILIETWTSNASKLDMLKEGCDTLRREIERVKISPPYLYDKTRDPNSAAFPKRGNSVFDDLTDEDVPLMSFDPIIEVDLTEQEDDEKV
jgi:hypothetical protein